jgi:hypothetical protein
MTLEGSEDMYNASVSPVAKHQEPDTRIFVIGPAISGAQGPKVQAILRAIGVECCQVSLAATGTVSHLSSCKNVVWTVRKRGQTLLVFFLK